MKYLFTDTNLAARRLKYLAEVFAPSTQTFISIVVEDPPQLVLDLGCGPGYTTHFLAGLTQSKAIVGLDNSAHFISLAERTSTAQVTFYRHDLTVVPFPKGPGDLLYARYLLTHLKDPPAIMDKWASQLQPGGLLLIEEVEWIQTANKVFRTYLEIVEAMLADQGNQLYLGATLNRLEGTAHLKKRASQVRRVPVFNHQAATLFYLNIQSWKHNDFVRANYTADMIVGLEDELKNLAMNTARASEIEWGMRQLVFGRY
jgi:trans-aconitate 2-methyltransferase